MKHFDYLYSQYYDLFYKDKNYEGEVEYINRLIAEYKPSARNILDLGCGTGRHAELLAEIGYEVWGVDISEHMLKYAYERTIGKEDRLFFSHSSIQNLELDKKFDVIISLFHVLSYQNSNKDVLGYFKTAKKHLSEGGIFIFDFWYGPAVLTEGPSIRMKRLENDQIRALRIAEPILKADKNLVEVNYDIVIFDKNFKETIEIHEKHIMRYFFDTELELFCDLTGFKVISKFKWMQNTEPDISSWNVVWVVRG